MDDDELVKALRYALGASSQADAERIARYLSDLVRRETLRLFRTRTTTVPESEERMVKEFLCRLSAQRQALSTFKQRILDNVFSFASSVRPRPPAPIPPTEPPRIHPYTKPALPATEGGASFPGQIRAIPPAAVAKAPVLPPSPPAQAMKALQPWLAEGGASFPGGSTGSQSTASTKTPAPPAKADPIPQQFIANPMEPNPATPETGPVMAAATASAVRPGTGQSPEGALPPEAVPIEAPPPEEFSILVPKEAAQPNLPRSEEVPPGAALWRYIPVPDAEDLRTDTDCRAFDAGPGWQLIGARVRGRKHKHEGTNCDDWFEAARSGGWDIVAVSDGAGSCALSRIGAQVSTKAAVGFLDKRLAGLDVSIPADLPADLLERDEQGAFHHPGVEKLQRILHETVMCAVEAVRDEANSRGEDIKKLSGTLRLAVHRLVDAARGSSLLMACCVGDGMTAAIDTAGGLHLLGQEESSGKHSGETEFLTDPRFVTPARLTAGTFACAAPLRAVMVMSDGVADPYFPNDPGMSRLYADLLLNGVLNAPGVDSEASLSAVRERVANGPDLSKYSYLIDTPIGIGPEDRMRARVRQCDRFAAELGVGLADLLKWPPALLIGGAAGEPMNQRVLGATSEERLRIWLDSFYVRGEFDDRTLVVFHREDGR